MNGLVGQGQRQGQSRGGGGWYIGAPLLCTRCIQHAFLFALAQLSFVPRKWQAPVFM